MEMLGVGAVLQAGLKNLLRRLAGQRDRLCILHRAGDRRITIDVLSRLDGGQRDLFMGEGRRFNENRLHLFLIEKLAIVRKSGRLRGDLLAPFDKRSIGVAHGAHIGGRKPRQNG